MKIIRNAALLAAAIVFFTCQNLSRPLYAAAQSAPNSTAQSSDKLGADTYAVHCAKCHGDHRQGMLPSFPPLIGVHQKMTDQQIVDRIRNGKGRMPAFPRLKDEEVASLVRFLATPDLSSAAAEESPEPDEAPSSDLAKAGAALFQEHCTFCHGRDAEGGETGPDLTQSQLVLADVGGDRISEMVRNGSPDKKMPSFNFSNQQLLSVAAFLHERVAASKTGKRRGVDVADLQTGNVEKGKAYFDGAGGCAKCHSPTGDLAGIASRYQGLQLEERMLYPKDATSRVTVTLPSGKKLSGTLAYLDEFTVGLRDSDGSYHSWATRNVKYTVDSPVNAHVDLFSKYTDDDIHNLMAYLQTLR